MRTLEDVRMEIEHLKQLPPRPRLERLMREGKGLVEMLEVMMGEVGRSPWNDHLGAWEGRAVRVDVPCAGAPLMSVGSPGATGMAVASNAIQEVAPATVESFVTGEGIGPTEEFKRKGWPKGKPRGKRAVENGGGL